jgi:hypothetical protein
MLMMDANVTRNDLEGMYTPPATKTWKPISHYALVQALVVEAQNLGLKVRSESWRVEDGALYPQKGEKVDIPNARLFGYVDFEPPASMDPTLVPSVGVVHANDMSSALSFFFGAHVLICSNGVRTGEFCIKRKHTTGLNFEETIDTVFARLKSETSRVEQVHSRMQGLPVTVDKAESLIVKAARAGAFPSSQIIPVIDEFEEPTYKEFAEGPRSLWRLYNSATHIMKKQGPARQGEAFASLNRVTFPLIQVA